MSIVIGGPAAPAASSDQLRQVFRGLHLRTSPDADLAATRVSMLACAEILCSDGVRRTPTTPLHATITTAGIHGLRASQAEAASTWYKVMYAYGASGEGLYLEQAKDYFLDESQTTDDSVFNFRNTTSNTKVGQTFDTDETGACDFVDLKVLKVASPTGRIWVSVYASSAGIPTGAALKTSDKLDVSLLSTSAQVVRFPFRDPQTLTAGTTYTVVAEGDFTIDGTNYVRLSYNTAGGYAAGAAYNFDGANWNEVTGDDLWFKVYVTRNDNAVTPPSGYDTGYAQIGWVYNNSSSNFIAFVANDRTVQYLRSMDTTFATVTAEIKTLTDFSTEFPPIPVYNAWMNVRANADVGVEASPNLIASSPAYMEVAVANRPRLMGPIHTEFQYLYLRVTATATALFKVPFTFSW